MNNISMSEQNTSYNIRIIELLEQLRKIKNIIDLKRILIFETEIESFAKEMDISYDCSKKIINNIYLEDLLKNIYKDSYLLIEKISQDILNNYQPDDYYLINCKEYILLYQKVYN
jgi:hypothetical protein